eukprot:gene25434-11094_t
MAASDETAQQNTDESPEIEIDRSKSALQDNIEKNGAQSYYFAHAKRDTGEAPAPLPVHTVIGNLVFSPDELVVTETIFSYQFLDDGKVVKVYVPLEGVGAAIEESDVSSSFEAKSLELTVRNFKLKRVLRLVVKELNGDIVPEFCKHKKAANRIILTLQKKADDSGNCIKWDKLSAK